MPQMTESVMDHILSLMEQGYPHNEIIAKLQEQGYTNNEIQEAFSQAQTKASVEAEPELPPMPPAPQMQPSLINREQPQMNFAPPRQPEMIRPDFSSREIEERMQELAESIIDEKWRKVLEDMGDLSSWKDRVKTEIVSVKQELLRMENRFEALQQSIFGRIREYDNQVEGVGTDVKAIEKLLQNILNPLADNVKELKRITEKLKR
jgi:DNA-binding transcriptional MerR regulator